MVPLFNKIAEWSKKDIIVIAYRPPVSHAMQKLENDVGLYDEQFIQTRVEKADGHWLNLNPTHFKTYDGSHLDKQSAIQLSEKIALEIQKHVIDK